MGVQKQHIRVKLEECYRAFRTMPSYHSCWLGAGSSLLKAPEPVVLRGRQMLKRRHIAMPPYAIHKLEFMNRYDRYLSSQLLPAPHLVDVTAASTSEAFIAE